MDAWAWIAEQRIAEAMDEGVFETRAFSGRRLQLEAALAIPEDRRLAYKVLENAGFVPPEVELRRELQELRQRLAGSADAKERANLVREVNDRVLRLNLLQRRPAFLEDIQVTGPGHSEP